MLGAVSMPLMVGSLLLAPRLIPAIYGDDFVPAVFCFQILAIVIPIRMLGHTFGTALTAADHQTHRTVAVAGAAALNVLLNLYFIPRWSYVGAAETTGITEVALFVVYAIMLRRLLGPSHVARAVIVSGLACVPLALAIVVSSGRSLVASIAAGGLAYCAGLIVVTLPILPRETWFRPHAALAALVGEADRPLPHLPAGPPAGAPSNEAGSRT
jgi:O-antigen/teichoic acid export membrane protein